MLTFNQIYSEAQEQVSDSSSDATTLIKRAINQGMRKFKAVMNRDWNISYKTFSLVADQQYYQMPEDAIRVKNLRFPSSNLNPPIEIEDEDIWNELNIRAESSSYPDAYFVRGSDEFGLYPTPSANVSNGGVLAYERRVRDMSVDDYTTGTVAVTNGSATITGSSTVFTQAMVGRTLIVEDANGDGMAYKIVSRSSDTSIAVENNYGGLTGSGLSYRIGEVPDIPEEFHENLVDYAMYRYYWRRKDRSAANHAKRTFDGAIVECQANYSSKTTSQYTRANKRPPVGYVHSRRELGIQ